MKGDKRSGIYCITNINTNKRYIGSTIHFHNRWKQHRSLLNRGKSTNVSLQHSWKKHGEDAFHFAILEVCEKEILAEREQFWIDAFRTFNRKCGYNIAPVVRNGNRRPLSPETLQRIRDANREIATRPETRAKHSANSKALMADPAMRKQICEAVKAAWTPERREQQAERMKGTSIAKGHPVTDSQRQARRASMIALNKSGEQRRRTAKHRRSLPWEAVTEIRRKYSEGATQTALGREYCVSQVCVGLIVNHKTYQNPV